MAKIFKSTTTTLEKYDGPVEIIRPLTRKEADAEVGAMFKCRAATGQTFDAYADELTEA